MDGLPVGDLIDWVQEHRTVKGFPGGDACAGSDVLTWKADVLIPAALGDVLTKDNAREIQADIILEGANGPTTPEANEILRKRNVLIIPDILANAGGVTVSYFEWAQNIQQFRWEVERVQKELSKIMRRVYRDVTELAKEKKIRFANGRVSSRNSSCWTSYALPGAYQRRYSFLRCAWSAFLPN